MGVTLQTAAESRLTLHPLAKSPSLQPPVQSMKEDKVGRVASTETFLPLAIWGAVSNCIGTTQGKNGVPSWEG